MTTLWIIAKGNERETGIGWNSPGPRRCDFWSGDQLCVMAKSLNLSLSLLPLEIKANKRLVPFAINMLFRKSDTCL